MIDEQSSASGHDYASNRSAIGAGPYMTGPGAFTSSLTLRRCHHSDKKAPDQRGVLSLECPLKTGFTVYLLQ